MNNNTGGMEGGLIEGLRQNAGWVTGIGILLLVMGILAIGSPLVTGIAITWTIGIFLIIGGASQCLLAFRAGAFGRALLVFLTGLVTLVAGGYMVSQPVAALASITLLLAAYFLATGVLAIIAGLQVRLVRGGPVMDATGLRDAFRSPSPHAPSPSASFAESFGHASQPSPKGSPSASV